MNLDDQLNLEHLLFKERTCRICGEAKDLIDGFYLTRKKRKGFLSSYSYECKECTIARTTRSRNHKKIVEWEYPDW